MAGTERLWQSFVPHPCGMRVCPGLDGGRMNDGLEPNGSRNHSPTTHAGCVFVLVSLVGGHMTTRGAEGIWQSFAPPTHAGCVCVLAPLLFRFVRSCGRLWAAHGFSKRMQTPSRHH